ncbi:MAG: SAM-dependent methyltransferase [Calditerrivibrio sp.]|nr:SAM-dependent methyltransferase [Calditerrivibrio sp.]
MSDQLKNIIIERIQQSGKITFAEFMDYALYYPKLGYYQKENPFGVTGSFYTSVNASEKFGFCLAKSFCNMIEQFNLSCHICEMGAGSGMLANDILNYYQEINPTFYREIKYTIIEKSDYLISTQKQTLQKHINKVSWETFDNFNNFNGIFFSNELVDAFPVHRIIRINDQTKEIFVIFDGDRFQFYPDTFSTPKLDEYMKKLNIKLIDKQIADINLQSTEWISSLASKLKKGFIITIDYGWTSDKLYAPFRMDGTVTCYFKHTQNNDFFDRIGEQDITAFVDFSALTKYGQDSGLTFVNLLPQSLYLVQAGILEFISKAQTDLERVSIKSLIIPEGGFGTNFHVLIQSKNINIPDNFIHKKTPTETYLSLAQQFSNIETL